MSNVRKARKRVLANKFKKLVCNFPDLLYDGEKIKLSEIEQTSHQTIIISCYIYLLWYKM